MNKTNPWVRFLLIAGYIAMLIGAIDPMEGSLLILPGSGLLVLGTFLGHEKRWIIIYRMSLFFLILIGVTTLWTLTVQGGFGGDSGRSIWWGLLFVPYLVSWSLGIWGPGSPRWVLWSGIGVGLWYQVIMVMTLKVTANFDESLEARIFIGYIAVIGVLTIGGCIYQLRKAKV
jgi:hypothetical protein